MYEGIFYNIPSMRDNYVQRPEPYDALLNHLLDLDRDEPLALYSPRAGDGKRTLATALCHNEKVQELFDAGILWFRIGENPDVPVLLKKLAHLIGEQLMPEANGDDEEAVEPEESFADEEIPEEEVYESYYLLVLDDVHNPALIYPFLKLGHRFDHLILTSSEDVLSVTKARTVYLNGMTDDEAVLLLASHLPQKPPQSALPHLLELAANVNHWPIALHLCGKQLQELSQNGDTLSACVTRIEAHLEANDAFIPEDPVPQEYEHALQTLLEFSLSLIPDSKVYWDLGVFVPYDPIPLTTLSALWHIDKLAALVERLAALGLVDYAREHQTIRLPDALQQHLARRASESLHSQLIERWGDAYNLPDSYAWDYYGYHLQKSGQIEKLEKLLFDFSWTQSRLKQTSFDGLWRDTNALEKSEDVRFVQEALKEAMGFLENDPDQFAEQLIARLPVELSERLDRLIEQAEKSRAGQIWLRPEPGAFEPAVKYFPLDFPGTVPQWDDLPGDITGTRLTHPGMGMVTPDSTFAFLGTNEGDVHVWSDPFNRNDSRPDFVLEGHDDWICLMEYDKSRQRLATASMDGVIVVWDLKTGHEIADLDEHMDKVTGIVFTADGKHLVSSSWDGAVIVWELDSADVKHLLEPEAGFIWAVALTPDGKQIIAACADQKIRVWDFENGARLKMMDCAAHQINHVLCTPDNRYCISAGTEIEAFDLMKGERAARFGTNALFDSLTLDTDGRTLRFNDLPIVKLIEA